VANGGSNFNTATSTYTASGKRELAAAGTSFQRYTKLTKAPAVDTTILAARAYAQLGNYGGEASAWEDITLVDPSQLKAYQCLAYASYAAKQTRKGDLAAAKALTLVPKLQRVTFKAALTAAKTQPAYAQSC
jgi:hypothetical protein